MEIATPKEGEAIALREAERLILWLCRRLRHREDFNDLLQHARIGALRAIRQYDPSKGALSTYIGVGVRSELAHYFIGLGREKRLCPGAVVSLDAPLSDEAGESLLDVLADERQNLAGAVAEKVDAVAYLGLIRDPRARRILEMHGEGYTLREIGQALGVSHERVRQIEAKALQEIRRSRQAGE